VTPSRRALLRGAARAGGVAAASLVLDALSSRPAAAQPRPEGPPDALARRRILVVGAGAGGLAAALELRALGAAVTVLEAADRVGGRALTLRAGDAPPEGGERVGWPDAPHLFLNAGAARIPHHHAGILHYARSLGVPMQPLINENRGAEAGGVPLGRAIADVRGVVAELAAKAMPAAALDMALTEEEVGRLRDLLRGFGALERDLRYRGSSRAGWAEAPGTGPGRVRAPLDLRVLLDPAVWRAASFAEGVNYAATMLEPVGGMDRISAAMAARLGDAVRLRAEVVRLRREGSGVRAELRDGTALRADAAVLALPPLPLARIDSDLDPARRAALASLPQSPAGKLGWYAPSRWWEARGLYGGIAWPRHAVGQVWYPSHGFHARDGVLLGAYIWDEADGERFAALDAAGRAAFARAGLETLHPGAAVERPVAVAWSRVARIGGAWTEWTPELRRERMAALAEPEGPYHFVGCHLSYLEGWQEGAVRSAWAAVARLRSALNP
jgi:monoamine oxidase